jgi:glycosyltransferase involved in cell wall biosynthesis
MTLGLFFTRGVSLKLWVDTGLYDREKLIYEEHLKKGNLQKIYWFTYGHLDSELVIELKKEKKLHNNIEVFQMPKLFAIPKVGSWFYTFVLSFLYKNKLKECDLFKTNQIDGSWSAVYAKKIYQKPLIVRTGYTITQLLKNKKSSMLRIKLYELVERYAYKNADEKIVSSLNNKEYLEQNYGLKDIKFITNFIDTNRFYNKNLTKYTDKILFVGRLNKEKNLFNLIEAISKTKYELDLYGQGELKNELKYFALKLNAKVNFKGTVANSELADIYNSYNYYILPSFFEGMPKTLLEAMACGCICIGTNVNGINEVISHNQNGILINGVDSNDIFETFKGLDNFEKGSISKNGIERVHNLYSFTSIVNQEKELIDGLINGM